MSLPPDASTPGSGVLRLLLVRHGQTPSNVARTLDTRLPGPGLTDLGRRQAATLGAELAGEDVEAVYHSVAVRARETAGLVGEALGLRPVAVEGLHEVQVGDLEGRADEPAVRRFRETFEHWRDGDLDLPYPNGETGRDLLDRYRAGLADVVARHRGGDTVVVVGHGAAIRFCARILVGEGVHGLPPAADDHLDNCGRVTLRGRVGDGTGPGWELESWLGDAPGGLRSAQDATTG